MHFLICVYAVCTQGSRLASPHRKSWLLVFKNRMSILMQKSPSRWGSQRSGGPVWSTGLFKKAASPVCLQLSHHGQLSLVDHVGKVHWLSGDTPCSSHLASVMVNCVIAGNASTSTSPGAKFQLSLTDEGVAVVKDSKAQMVWSTDDSRQSIAGGESLMPNQKLSSKSGDYWLLM